MSGKDTRLYKEVFNYIEENVFKLMPSSFMTDFEAGLRRAIHEHWQSIRELKLYSCWYHYCAAIRRRIRTLQLLELIADNSDARKIYRKLLSLPLLPTELIEHGYQLIKEDARAKNLLKAFRKFFQYFESFWLNLVIFSKSIIIQNRDKMIGICAENMRSYFIRIVKT